MAVAAVNISDTLVALAACLCEELNDPDLCFCGVLPGAQPYDAMGTGCTNHGQAWVRLASGFPSNRVGEPVTTVDNCDTGQGYTVEVGILRKFPIQAQPLKSEVIIEHALAQIADMELMRKAISCCDALRPKDFILGGWNPIGPDGDVIGGTWTLTLGLL